MDKSRKFLIYFLLILVFVVSGCGMAKPKEQVSAKQLLDDLSNGARAKANEGKEVIIAGQVGNIGEDSCWLSVFKDTKLLTLELPKDCLLNLNEWDFIAVKATVVSYDERTSRKNDSFNDILQESYTLKAKELLGDDVIEEFIKEYVSDYAFEESTPSDVFYNILEEVDIETLVGFYDKSSKLRRSDEELENYLVGKWYNGFGIDDYVEYKADGTYDWTFKTEFVGDTKRQTGKWNINSGMIDSVIGGSGIIYVLTDDIFIGDSMIYIRVKE